MNGIPEKDNILLLVIDVQEGFRPAIFEFDRVIGNCSKLIRSFETMGLPMMHTEQYPKGLGSTVFELNMFFKDKPLEKTEFSCFRNEAFKESIKKLGKKQLAVCGIEAHVCILQTALDGIAEGYEVFLVEDAISSRKGSDKKIATERMAQSGVYRVSSEMLIFQLLNNAGTSEFKEIQKIVK
jgi:nicotinamidase-related amidase